MEKNPNTAQNAELDVASILLQAKRMLRELQQANLDRSQLSAKPLGLTLLLVSLITLVAGILYKTEYFGSDLGMRVSFASNAFMTGITMAFVAGYLLRPGIRLTAIVKTLSTLSFGGFYLIALWLNGAIPGLFLPVLIVALHLIWSVRMSLALSMLIIGFAGFMMLQDSTVKPFISIRILFSASMVLLIMQILTRQIISSYRKSLNVSEQLSVLVMNLDKQLEQNRYQLEMAMRTDSDSGLMNITGFDDLAESRILVAREGMRYALLSIKFKGMEFSKSLLNEHERNILLKIISQRLWRAAGPEGIVARAAPSDFLVLMKLEEGDGRNDDMHLAAVFENLGHTLEMRHHSVPCQPYIGFSVWPADGGNSPDLRKKAETAARMAIGGEAKSPVRFESSMQQAIRERIQITSSIQTAIDVNEFELEYQPVFELGFDRFSKVEALIRWNHPELGRLPPTRFIPLLSEEQLVDVTVWVLHAVKTQMEQWRAANGIRLEVAVNIPAAYLKDRIIQSEVFFKRLESFDRDTGNVIFEITEGNLFEAGESGLAFIAEIRRRGFKVALDDFGTGFANLRQLESLQLDILKIDKSLIDEIGESERKMALCGYIIRLGHELGLKVVAEGIETERQRDALIWAGCDYGQGYLFSKPMAENQIPAFFNAKCSKIA